MAHNTYAIQSDAHKVNYNQIAPIQRVAILYLKVNLLMF